MLAQASMVPVCAPTEPILTVHDIFICEAGSAPLPFFIKEG